jgi:hypothetical protein
MTQLDVDVTGAIGSAVFGINNERRVCGYYYTKDAQTSFIAQLTP